MKRFCSVVLVVLMLVSVLPMSVFAAGFEDSLASVNFTVIDSDQSTLAPGVTMDEMVVYNNSNQRVEMYVTTVDTTVDTVQVKANYKDNQNAVFGMQALSDQVAAMEANYEEPFKIVAGINASYYNTTTGQPTGAFVMEGIDASANGDGYSFFAVLKDGTYMIGSKGEYSNYKAQIQEAIGGWIHLVKDGAVCSGLDDEALYPRQTLGLTADNKLILMTADGSQAPQTVGLTVQEQAEIMQSMGCVEAIHLDGGNSATFGAIREGTDEFVTVNSPSGGAERQVSNTLMVISTAVPDGTFDHAVIDSEYDYFVANSQYTFTAFGVDAANGAADIPETAVWTLSDDSFGTISDGTFVSNGQLGQVDIQLSDNDKVIGSKTINVVTPTSISFESSEATIPYTNTVVLPVNAMYGNYSVYATADAYTFAIDPATAGVMDGFNFTAGNDGTVKSATVTATYKYDANVAASSITVKFGEGTEVLFDFEDGDISDWRGLDTIDSWITEEKAKYPDTKHPIVDVDDYNNGVDTHNSTVFLSTESDGGQVKNGEYSLGVTLDRLNAGGVGSWLYNYIYYTGDPQVWRDVANGKSAVRVGMWVYLPQEAENTAFRLCRTFDDNGVRKSDAQYMMSDYDGKKVSYNTNYAIPESGWIYIYYDLTSYDFQSSTQYNPDVCYAENYRSDKGHNISTFPAFLQFINGDKNDTMEKLTLYIDDITLDYSEITEDRDAPVISETTVCSDTANFVAINGQTVNNNILSFSAKATDVSGNSNATGLDYKTAKILIDGIDVSDNKGFKSGNGYITLTDVYLTNGKHNVTFVIEDKQGNETSVTKALVVAGSASNATVTLTGHNDGNNVPKTGSVYYIDVKASDASAINEIKTVLSLNSANTFEYENIICADGVTVEATKDPIDNELTLVIKNESALTGDAVLASIPVRVWSWNEEITGITADKQFASGSIPVIDIDCKTLYGQVSFNDNEYNNYVCSFADSLNVKTEIDNSTAWHKHTAEALDDVAATCTEDGYTGRTYCDVCKSVVDWGTTVTALGHNWVVNENGALACANDGELFNGTYTDGKTYVDGFVVADGWVEVDGVKTYYYVDGVKLTGSHYMDNVMYTFDDNGKYLPDYRYDGWYEIDDTAMYFVNNEYVTGYMMQDYRPYYFDDNGRAYDGKYVINGEVSVFDNGLFSYSENEEIVEAGWCGADLYSVEYTLYKNGTIKITGKGAIMNFAEVHVVPWINYTRNDIKSIVIGKDISKVGNHAFRNCFVAKSITFEEGSCVTFIGMRAFHNMRALTDVVLPETVETLRWSSFGYSYALKNIYLPANLKTIEKDAFVKTNADVVMNVEDDSVAEEFAVTYGYNHTVREKVLKNGVFKEGDKIYYYVDGERTNAGLVKVDGYYYYASSGGAVKTGKYWVSRTNDLLKAGYYYFDTETGRMDIKNGVYAEDDGLYYYVDGARTNAGLVKVDGYYYYASSGGAVKTGKYWVSRPNGLLKEGYYFFDTETGRMDIKNGVYAEDGGLYYYVDDVRTNAGLVKVGEDYYYASTGGAVKTGKYWVSRPNDLLPAGYYYFDTETGKMIL